MSHILHGQYSQQCTVPVTLLANPALKPYSQTLLFCPACTPQGNDEAFAFLEGVLDQVVGQFPCSYIHIGGDEVPKVRGRRDGVGHRVRAARSCGCLHLCVVLGLMWLGASLGGGTT